MKRVRKTLWLAAVLLAVTALVAGCGYYRQAIRGQWQIFSQRQPISELLTNAATPVSLSNQLQLVLRLREFAERELALPANGHYLRYVDLHRRFVVWDVYAAPEFSLEAKSWWYPVVGRLTYRGYFVEDEARRYAAKLRARGYDVYVGGVEAYSTLGWFRDPVLSSFIHHREADLAEILFHELAHQKVFAHGDTDFNEAFATAVAEEGVRRWFQSRGDTNSLQRYEESRRREDQWVAVLLRLRHDLESIYQHVPRAPVAELRREKQRIGDQLRRDYDALNHQWGGAFPRESWFDEPFNNARLNTTRTYYEWVPAFRSLLAQKENNLVEFFREASRLARLSKAERKKRLFDQ